MDFLTPPPLTACIMPEPGTGTEPLAMLSIYHDAPSLDGLRTAAFGGLSFKDPAAADTLIAEQCRLLRQEGYQAVIGPMNGDTWHSYRYVIESDGSPPYLMEPEDRPAERAALERAGFKVVATYSSARAPLDVDGEQAASDEIVVAPWDGSDPERFMAAVYEMSCEAFSRNPFYKPLDRAGFDGIYRPLLGRIHPRLMLFAHDRATGELLGFVFGIPDLLSPQSRTAILKTYASRRRGAGRLLLEAFNRSAKEAGFTSVIHALMHEQNESADRSKRHQGTVFRRYGLFGLRL